MSEHVSDDLPQLLTGDATREVVMRAAAHLRTCPDCQQELVSAVVAHASLTSAHRFAPEMVSSDQPAAEEEPDPGPLPDLSSLFAQARQDAEEQAARPARNRRRLVAVAAAAAVVVGGGATVAAITLSGPDSTTRSVALEGVGGTHDTKVQIADGSMRLDASALPALGAKHQYEVWLTSKDFARKQSVGFIDDGARSATFSVPQKVMSQYNDIAVSVQEVHQTAFSGQVVLHGRYG